MVANNQVYLLTGSNLGDRTTFLEQAKSLINNQAGKVISYSNLYETSAWGNIDQPNFLNQALEISTLHPPKKLLDILLEIENTIGRVRQKKWGARCIDIDILFYEDQVIDTKKLVVPHPHLHKRNFTLIPLMEIAAEFEHPVLKKTIESLYWDSEDTLEVYLSDDL